MGIVYRGYDTRLHRPVAVKVLSPEAAADPECQRRFLKEARAASRLNHPNIVQIYEIVETGDSSAIVMEFIEGEPLGAKVAWSSFELPKNNRGCPSDRERA